MQNKQQRILLDTNIWISFLITKDYSKLEDLIFTRKTILLFSRELLDEFIAVAKRPKFRRWFSSDDVESILETIDEYAEFVTIKSKITICKDPKDNFLLSLSVDGNADFLITGDQDLLDLKKMNNTKILTISNFLQNY